MNLKAELKKVKEAIIECHNNIRNANDSWEANENIQLLEFYEVQERKIEWELEEQQ